MGEIIPIQSLAYSNKLPSTQLASWELFLDCLHRESVKSLHQNVEYLQLVIAALVTVKHFTEEQNDIHKVRLLEQKKGFQRKKLHFQKLLYIYSGSNSWGGQNISANAAISLGMPAQSGVESSRLYCYSYHWQNRGLGPSDPNVQHWLF